VGKICSFTARYTLVQSALEFLEFFWNNFRVIYPGMFALCRPKHQGSPPRGTPGNFGPYDPPPVDLSVRDIRSQIAAEWLQIAQWSQWRAYRKPPSLFRLVPSLTPYDLPFPQNGGSICTYSVNCVSGAVGVV